MVDPMDKDTEVINDHGTGVEDTLNLLKRKKRQGKSCFIISITL